MTAFYSLTTPRLTLRPMQYTDAPRIQQLAGAWEVAYNTLSMPHPYPDGAAEGFISAVRDEMLRGEAFVFAMALRETDEFIGCIGLTLQTHYNRAELGYWLGVPYWNQGYTSEAAIKMVQFGFETLELNRIYAACFTRNPASAKVMVHAGLTYEGTLRQHYRRFDEFQDTAYYGLLREDYLAAK